MSGSDVDVTLLVLHGLRLSSLAGVEQIAQRWSLTAEGVADELARAADAGWARERTGRLSGWSLTAEGRTEGERLLAVELAERGAAGVLGAAYDEFRALNSGFLRLCTDWQLREGPGGPVPNDHLDEDYDRGVVERLGELHDEIVATLLGVPVVLPRYSSYAPRMARALHLVRDNDLDWFTKPVIDSYHTIWFELHEDLLATLGLDRAAESAAAEASDVDGSDGDQTHERSET